MEKIHYQMSYSSPIGQLTIASDGQNITGVWMADQKYYAAGLPERTRKQEDLPVFLLAGQWLDSYFRGEEPAIAVPLAPQGSEFRQSVWQILLAIPYGEVTTYGDIAKQIARKNGEKAMSAQAVGGAVGHNPISILIPCHRVIGSNGSLTGYAGGLDKKIKLLQLENVNMDSFFIPKKGTAL